MGESITRELPLEQATCTCGCGGPEQATESAADQRASASDVSLLLARPSSQSIGNM